MLKTIISVLQYEVLCEQTWAASVRTALRTIHYVAISTSYHLGLVGFGQENPQSPCDPVCLTAECSKSWESSFTGQSCQERKENSVIRPWCPIVFLLPSVSRKRSHDHHVPGNRTAAYTSQRVSDWALSEESQVAVDARHSALLHVEFSIGDGQGKCPSSVTSKSGHEPTAKPAAAFQ